MWEQHSASGENSTSLAHFFGISTTSWKGKKEFTEYLCRSKAFLYRVYAWREVKVFLDLNFLNKERRPFQNCERTLSWTSGNVLVWIWMEIRVEFIELVFMWVLYPGISAMSASQVRPGVPAFFLFQAALEPQFYFTKCYFYNLLELSEIFQ